MQDTAKDVCRPHTLASIAEAHGVNKRSAQNWLRQAKEAEGGEIGELMGKTRYFSDDERDILLGYAGEPRDKAETVSTTGFTTPVQPTVIQGNHRSALTSPSVPQSVDLGQFRGDSQVQAYENPLEMIQVGMQLIDSVNGAMQQDLQNRISLYQQTEAATAELKRKAEELQQQQTRYQIESDLLGILQNQKTTELSDLMGKVQALGGGPSSQ